MNLHDVDKTISEIAGKINFYSFLTPTNQDTEREKFFDALGKGEEYNPVFSYKTKDVGEELSSLEALKKDLDSKDSLSNFFIEKIDFFLRQLKLLRGEDKTFLEDSISLFGAPTAECIQEAKTILSSYEEDEIFTKETVTPKAMKGILEDYIHKNNVDWQVKLSDKLVPKITVSGREGVLYINSRISYTPEEVERLKVHEVEVHIYRGANGKRQPYNIFAEGTCGYDETEEGLAIINEEIRGVLKLDKRQMRLYAGRAVCTDLALKSSFYETFEELREYFPDYIAYRLVERAKRGLVDTSKKGALTKGHHYISGLQKIRKYISSGGDIKILYVGKIGINDVGAVNELLSEGVLKEPKYLPEFVEE